MHLLQRRMKSMRPGRNLWWARAFMDLWQLPRGVPHSAAAAPAIVGLGCQTLDTQPQHLHANTIPGAHDQRRPSWRPAALAEGSWQPFVNSHFLTLG